MTEQNLVECHGLDTPERVCFYEQDFYVLSNFSAFMVDGFATAEHRYHWWRFQYGGSRTRANLASTTSPWILSAAEKLADLVHNAKSAHEAFRLAQDGKQFQRPDWDEIKVGAMRDILWAKVQQHEYVHRKLLATGDRELVENSWRDDYWGWGPNRDGQNMLGKLWMEVRDELRRAIPGEL